ncbi:hypothetical protein M0811_03557 [Anaeramoeba ignava]|uniref:Uncharacterized protein n=1 Tax=Anaeramoeba ignava TaxID=1746090 RepID=A0A9Q0R4X6_ANAIG|nr:hypothetical protein M0811_03557 [Anaeramoeba ignava]|eukprot:Anaeramoba_ignava/a483825_12.p1 GENE.a483825_12~~a483825_12.p1  ORF type:complete len:369 (-),score=146.05 a483825_12:41-1147(-)
MIPTPNPQQQYLEDKTKKKLKEFVVQYFSEGGALFQVEFIRETTTSLDFLQTDLMHVLLDKQCILEVSIERIALLIDDNELYSKCYNSETKIDLDPKEQIVQLSLSPQYTTSLKLKNESQRFVLHKLFQMFHYFRGNFVEMIPIVGHILGVKFESRAIINRCMRRKSATFEVEVESTLNQGKFISNESGRSAFLRVDPFHVVLSIIKKEPIFFYWDNEATKLFKIVGDKTKLLLGEYSLKCQSEALREIIFQVFYNFAEIASKIGSQKIGENPLSSPVISPMINDLNSPDKDLFSDFYDPNEIQTNEKNQEKFPLKNIENHPFFVSPLDVQGFEKNENIDSDYEQFNESNLNINNFPPSLNDLEKKKD